MLTAEEDHIKLHQALLEEDKNCKIISAHIKILETALLKKMDGFSGIEGIVELRGNVIKSVLDKKYIKENFPAEYNAFCKDTLKFSGSFNPKGLITLSKIDKELDTALKGLNSPKFTAADTQLPLMHKSAELEQLHLQLIMLNKEMQEAEWKKLQWQTRLQAAVGDYAGIEGLCTWERKNKTSVEFDEKGFLRQYPQMEQYKTEAKESVAVIFRPYRAYPFQVNLT